jgi:hypothetical protein
MFATLERAAVMPELHPRKAQDAIDFDQELLPDLNLDRCKSWAADSPSPGWPFAEDAFFDRHSAPPLSFFARGERCQGR